MNVIDSIFWWKQIIIFLRFHIFDIQINSMEKAWKFVLADVTNCVAIRIDFFFFILSLFLRTIFEQNQSDCYLYELFNKPLGSSIPNFMKQKNVFFLCLFSFTFFICYLRFHCIESIVMYVSVFLLSLLATFQPIAVIQWI